MITVAKTRIVSPDFVVLLESVGEILKIEKKNKTKTKKNTNRHPPSSFVSLSTTYVSMIVSQQCSNTNIHTLLFRLNNTVTINSYTKKSFNTIYYL